MTIKRIHIKNLRGKGAHVLGAALLFCVFSPVVQAVFAQADDNQGSGSSNVFRFLIAVVCFFAPYCLVFKIIQFIGGIPHALTSALRGRTEGVMAKVKGFAGEARQTTAPSLRAATFKAGLKEVSTEKSLDKLSGRSRAPRWMPGRFGTAYNRAAQMRASYTADADAKRIAAQDMIPLQALDLARGDTEIAKKILHAQGYTNFDEQLVGEAKSRFQELGGNFTNMTASMREAIGNTAAQRGDLVGPWVDAFRGGDASHTQHFTGIDPETGNATYEAGPSQGGLYAQAGGSNADAGGMAHHWTIEARGKGQYSMDVSQVSRLSDLNAVSNSDLGRTLDRVGQYFQRASQAPPGETPTLLANGTINQNAGNAHEVEGVINAIVRTGARGGLAGSKQREFERLFEGWKDDQGTHGPRIQNEALRQQIQTRIDQERANVRISA